MNGLRRAAFHAWTAFCLLAVLSLPVPAAQRVALVIGNAEYRHTAPLRNPRNDAADVARALEGLGFEVIEGIDADKSAFESMLREFAKAAHGAEVTLFFYAGHGLQVEGENYLVPIDARLADEVDLDLEAFELAKFMRRMRGGTNLVFLDACRDNPLASNLVRSMGPTRSAAVGRGLGRVETGSGTLIAYATQPGNVADDGEGRNSPFTGALLAHIATPGLSVDALLARVTDDVMKGTGERQQPWRHSSLRKPFYFVPPSVTVPPPVTGPDNDEGGVGTVGAGSGGSAAAGQIVKAQRMETERKFWASVEGSGNPAKYRAYLEKYGDGGEFSRLARIELEELEGAGEAQRPVGAARQVGERFRDCDGTWCPEVVVVPGGSFEMGSPEGEAGREDDEGPVHRVRIEEPIAVGVTEVTRGEFGRFVRETGHSMGDGCWTYEDGEWEERSGWSWRNPGYSQTDGHPMVCVNWEDARAYVKWLSRETGQGYRLLSEGEWEYVARGGTSTSRYWGAGESGQCRHANGADASAGLDWGVSCDDGHSRTSPVGSYTENGYGLYDVLGNVWEWVEDCWNADYTGAPSNGSAWESGDCTRRVLRGGSWYTIRGSCVPRVASGTPPGAGTTSPVSELPGRWIES